MSTTDIKTPAEPPPRPAAPPTGRVVTPSPVVRPDGANGARKPALPALLADLVTEGEDRGELPPAIVVVHGGRGLGKTSFGAVAPGAVTLAIEDPELASLPRRVKRIVVASKDEAAILGATESEDEGARKAAQRAARAVWCRTMSRLQALRDQPHDYKVAVVDTLDALEAGCHAFCCIRDKQDRIGAPTKLYGYGEGYKIAVEEWRAFEGLCQELKRKRGMFVVWTAHSAAAAVKDATMPDHEKQSLKLHKLAAAYLCDQADAVIYVRKDSTVWTDGTDERARMKIRQGQRSIAHTRVGDGWEAKNRLFLPDPLPVFSWAAFIEGVREGAEIRERIFAHLETLPIVARIEAEHRLGETGWAVATALQILNTDSTNITDTAIDTGDQAP